MLQVSLTHLGANYAGALVIALTLVSESGPSMIPRWGDGASSEVQTQSLGRCRALRANLYPLERNRRQKIVLGETRTHDLRISQLFAES